MKINELKSIIATLPADARITYRSYSWSRHAGRAGCVIGTRAEIDSGAGVPIDAPARPTDYSAHWVSSDGDSGETLDVWVLNNAVEQAEVAGVLDAAPVRSITVKCSATARHDAIEALNAAMTPFGSLQSRAPRSWSEIGDDHVDLATRLVEWAESGQRTVASSILSTVLDTECDQHSAIEFGLRATTLTTPTSGTRISVRAWSGGYTVLVAFGEDGSTSRAAQIAEALERAGVRPGLGVDFQVDHVGLIEPAPGL